MSAIQQAAFWHPAAGGGGGGGGFPALPFMITFDESGVPSIGSAIGTFYTASHGITALPSAVIANRVYTSGLGVGIPGSDYDLRFAWVFNTTTIGFQLDAALQTRAVTFYAQHGGNWSLLTVKTSVGVTESFSRTTGGQFSWVLNTEVDLDNLAIGRPTLSTGYLTEFYFSNTAGTFAIDNLTLLT